MKIVIIGSKGFIGNHLYSFFRKTGHDVVACDVVVDYNDANYYQVDATNPTYEEIFRERTFDVCINASGASSVPDSFVHPGRDFHLNSSNVYTLLSTILKTSPACRFLNLSSAAVYGNPSRRPIDEGTSLMPLSPYGMHKWYSELICTEFYEYFKLQTCSVRIFSAYGPGLRKQLFWDWWQKIQNSDSISVYGTGDESRDFIFIDDLVRAIDCVIKKGDFRGDQLNVANGSEVFIKDAVEVYLKHSRKKFSYKFSSEAKPGYPVNWVADIQRLKSCGYKQEVSFDEGIKRYLKWLDEGGLVY